MLYLDYMNIGINASFLRKPDTGIGQVTIHFLQALAKLEGKGGFSRYQFFLYCEEDPHMTLPNNFHIRAFLPAVYRRDDLIRRIWWERYALPRHVASDGCESFISLYQSATVCPRSVRHSMVVHDMIPRIMPEYLNNMRKRAYQFFVERGIQRSDALIAISSKTEKDIIRLLGENPKRISVAHIDVDPLFRQEISDAMSLKTMKKYHLRPGYVYCGGGLEMRKNIDGLLRAYKLFLEQSKRDSKTKPNFLVISGRLMPQLSPIVTDVESLVRKLDITPYVKILGHVPQEFLPALYKNASLFIYPSKYEGFGMPVLEAMCVGTPIAISKTSSLPEVAADAAVYFYPEHERDMASVMRRVLGDKKIREELSRRGKARSKLFSWNSFVKRILDGAVK